MDKGKYVATEEGSAQGNIISPVLANIYMHFVLVLWYKEIIEKRAEGENFLVVYADDFIAGFQYQNFTMRLPSSCSAISTFTASPGRSSSMSSGHSIKHTAPE